jgi:hypothetical protein
MRETLFHNKDSEVAMALLHFRVALVVAVLAQQA